MCASGLEEVLSITYGSSTVQHVLSGKAYARVLHVHFLVHGALTYILVQILQHGCCCDDNVLCSVDLDSCLSAGDVAEVSAAVDRSLTAHICVTDSTVVACASLATTNMLLSDLKQTLCSQSCTARLWLLYMHYIDTVKQFIASERTSDWLLHLSALHDMLDCLRQLVLVIMPKQCVCIFNKCILCRILIHGFMSNS